MPMTHTNPVKKYNNWDMCYSCGFDVESGHTSMTCTQKKEGHQTGCNRGNYLQYQAMGHHPSRRDRIRISYRQCDGVGQRLV
jgi:hypothetical protein